MTKTSGEIHEILRPNCRINLVADKSYSTINANNLKGLLKVGFIDRYKFKAEVFDCDDYALILHAWIRQIQYKEKWENPMAFGEAWGKFGNEEHHALNIAISHDSEILIIEPQTDEVRYYDETKDSFILIRM